MSKSPQTNADGFALALAYFVKQNGGRKYGAKTLMATAIGVSRAVVDSWEGVGIPRRHLATVSGITGIAMTLLRPDQTK